VWAYHARLGRSLLALEEDCVALAAFGTLFRVCAWELLHTGTVSKCC